MKSKETKPTHQIPVYLNIYSFCHCCNVICGSAGLGLYHTAIQILQILILQSGIQYMFHGWSGNQTGIAQVQPKSAPYRFQKQILLGHTTLSYDQFDQNIIQPLKNKFISNTYDLFNNNCNHFAYQLTQQLGFQNQHPNSYIFRVTNIANLFRCCLPKCILSGRLDWFNSKQDQYQELQQIKNSQVNHLELNSSRYQEFLDSHPDQNPDLSISSNQSYRIRRQKIFKNTNNS